MSVKYKRLLNLTYHKHEPQSSLTTKLTCLVVHRDAHLNYKKHSLENFVSMAIQSTQVPMYTKHTLFLYFSDFSNFFYFYEEQNKAKLKK